MRRKAVARVAPPAPGAGQGQAAPGGGGVVALMLCFVSASVLCVATTNIRLLVFVPSVSENISCVGFLKPKIAENRNWRSGILLIC